MDQINKTFIIMFVQNIKTFLVKILENKVTNIYIHSPKKWLLSILKMSQLNIKKITLHIEKNNPVV